MANWAEEAFAPINEANVERLMQLMSEHELNLKYNKSAGWRYTKQN